MASFAARPSRATRVPRASRAARASRTHGNPLLKPRLPEWRSRFVVAMVALGFLGLIARAGYLQLFSHDYLQRQGELRYGRTLELPASRGSIYDRNRVLLAASRPVRGIFAVPRNLQASPAQLEDLARLLGMSQAALGERLAEAAEQHRVAELADDPDYVAAVETAMDIYMREMPQLIIAEELHVITMNDSYWTGWPNSDDSYIAPYPCWSDFTLAIYRIKPTR